VGSLLPSRRHREPGDPGHVVDIVQVRKRVEHRLAARLAEAAAG
jgi:hypothetical protein